MPITFSVATQYHIEIYDRRPDPRQVAPNEYEQTYVPDTYKSIFLARTNSDKDIALAPDRIHTSNFGSNSRIVLAPQPNNQLHGTLICDIEFSKGFTTKEETLVYFDEQLPVFHQLISDEEATALLQRQMVDS